MHFSRNFIRWPIFAVTLSLLGLVGQADDRKGGAEKKVEAKEGKRKLSLPLVQGHDSRGLKIPLRDEDGKLQMIFTIDLAMKLDGDRVQMKETQVETFGEEEKSEMLMVLPSSVLDLNSRVITSAEPVTIKRSDFEITGETMEFNTETRAGKLGGKVRMVIYNVEEAATETKGNSDE